MLMRISVLYALAVAAVILTAGAIGTDQAFGFVTRWPGGDKLGHFGLMGGLALMFDRACRKRDVQLGRLRVPLAPAIVAALVFLEELSQLWLPGRRTFDWLDLAADALGIASCVWLGRRMEAT